MSCHPRSLGRSGRSSLKGVLAKDYNRPALDKVMLAQACTARAAWVVAPELKLSSEKEVI